jgi:RNA polymerase sigma-70 factor (ECF subfamily)
VVMGPLRVTTSASTTAPGPGADAAARLLRRPEADVSATHNRPMFDRAPENETELSARFERDVVPLIPRLYGGARRMTASRADAEDLVQDTLLKAYARFGTFRSGTYLRAWLFRIMYNTWVNGHRHVQRRPLEILSGDISEDPSASRGRTASFGSASLRSAEVQVLIGLRDSQIAAAVDKLHDDLRSVLYYACVDGLRYKDIAELMDIPLGTVMSRLHRARKQLRSELADVAEECGLARRQSGAEAV